RHVPHLRSADRPGAARGDPMGDAVHRLQAEGRAALSEPARRPDAPIGARADGLAPVSVARRSLAATPSQWLGLAMIAIAAVLADQLTKQLVASTLGLDEQVHL